MPPNINVCLRYSLHLLHYLTRLFGKRRGCVCCFLTVLFLLFYLFKIWTHAGVVINIVEEHHEVLPYWFHAASKGKIELEGNTLIHIDAHPDDAAPEYFPGYPYFRPPHSDKELGYMMQRNDMFIQAAIMTGLINRVIHIWPSWSRNVYKKSYTFRKIGLGSAEVKGNEEVFCECVERAGVYEHCMFMNYTKLALYNKDPETRIKAHRCDFHAAYDFEALDEDKALSLTKRGNWLDKKESVILDIDEDFFGVESVFSTMFAQNKLSYKKHMLKIANITSSIFCPDDCEQEQEIDKFLVEVIDMILKSGHWSQPSYCFLPSETKRIIRTKFIELLENNLFFCRKSPKTLLSLWDNFLHFYLNVTKEQLHIMKEIGFCFETGPRTLGFYDPDDDIKAFIPCVGRNVPGDTMVSLYSPDSQDIQFYTDKLYNVLSSLEGVTPKLVTIGRSMRDGFTPRKYFHQIEKNIIETVKKAWNNVRFRLHYDENLLGGQKGWPNRHKIRKN